MTKYKTMDANEAVSISAYNFSEVCGIYPITPASPMAENIDVLANSGKLNYFDKIPEVIEMQSEAGAVAVVHGSLQAGSLGTTFTASQGLLLMIPTLYKLAGEMLPAVIHVASRALSTHALSIFGDHQDIYAVRMTGVCMLASSSPLEAYHLSNIAHLSAIKASLPFVHFFDGFRTSHEINKIKLLDDKEIYSLLDKDALNKFRERALNPSKPVIRGTAENDDIYFQHMESRNTSYLDTVKIVNDYMEKFNKIEGTNYAPFNYYGHKKATSIIVAMGSICETIKETIDYLNNHNYKVGLVIVHLYRPFSKEYLTKVLPKTVKNIAVLDRTKEPGSEGEPLYLDIVSALKDYKIKIIGGRYGLSSKNTTPSQIKAVYDFLVSKNSFSVFTIGIEDDVTNLSLKIDNNFHLNTNAKEILIYGYGSDGMVSTSKDILKIIGDNTDNYVQGYFQYDSKKSGGVTRSHLRLSNKEIRSTYYVDNPSLLVVSKDNYMYKYDILDNLKDNGIFLLNTSLSKEDLIRSLPNKVKYLLAKKNAKFYYIDAYKIVNELGLKNKISTCMEICILKILDLLDINKTIEIMKKQNEKRFLSKGEKIININNSVVDNSLKYLKEIEVDNSWTLLKYKDIAVKKNFNDIINSLEGDSLKVSEFLDKKDGSYEAGTSKYEKRGIAENVPVWIKENCIECNQCSFVCPHAVIRPFLTLDKENSIKAIGPKMPNDYQYKIAISYKDCTGCGVCVSTCPGKNKEKALRMESYDIKKHKEEEFTYLLENNLNNSYTSASLNVKNSQFIMPKFEFSGACAGCGETAYLKNLTEVCSSELIIANATGCSSIYGASAPNMPYNLPWASSLFEDNAEYGFGILKGSMKKREGALKVIKELSSKVDEPTKELLNILQNNFNDIKVCKEISKKLDYQKYKELERIKDDLVPKTIFIVGGDGFAYDIGYGGIDHVLSRNENINILVLDTEVYSNTGGQSSKSSNIGSVASFTAKGKRNYKKDLAKMALAYPHVYVATTNIGYNKEQYLKVLKEAVNYNGPSLIIAYAPCIEHGITNGMEHSLENAYLATKCGYFITFRYNPEIEEFNLDSKDIDFDLYDEFLNTANRYKRLKTIDENLAKELLDDNKKWAVKRYEFYQKLEK